MWMNAVPPRAELPCSRGCYKIAPMRIPVIFLSGLIGLTLLSLMAHASAEPVVAAPRYTIPVASYAASIADRGSWLTLSSQERAAKKSTGQKKSSKRTPGRPPSQQKPTLVPRQSFSARDQDLAKIPNIPDARFWADSAQDFIRALPATPGPWLLLSTGGEDGAYGAGVMVGWSAAGTRPNFSVITAVSTGALMAPFVFAGAKYDEQLRAAYTTVNAVDIFEIGGKGESLLDTWPLKDLVAKQFTRELLHDVAAEHERGRRLFVLTTNLDAGRPVAWDIGAIASRRDQQALELIRSILIAAISVPGAFPPMLIEAEAGGTRFHEMHVDGGLAAQFYLAPDKLQLHTSTYKLPAAALYVIINMKLGNDFMVTERSILGILGRTVTAAIRVIVRNAIDRAYVVAERSNIPFHLAFIDDAFHAPSRGAFDSDYMKALFEFGYREGKSGTAFRNEPQDILNRPTKAAR
jgi:hypothetical protein